MQKNIVLTGATRGVGRALIAPLTELGPTVMLRSCWADSAAACPSPTDWARRAVPFLLSLSAAHNGQALSV